MDALPRTGVRLSGPGLKMLLSITFAGSFVSTPLLAAGPSALKDMPSGDAILWAAALFSVLGFGVWAIKTLSRNLNEAEKAAEAGAGTTAAEGETGGEEDLRQAARFHEEQMAELRRQSAALERQSELLAELVRELRERG